MRIGSENGVDPSVQGDGARARVDLLYREHAGVLRRRLRARLGSSEDANDVVQDAFARLLGARPLAGVREPGAFLNRIVRNLLVDRSRRRSARPTHVAIDDESIGAVPPDQGQTIEYEQMRARYKQLIAALPPRMQQVFVLHRLDGLSYKEIAEQLDISIRTVEYIDSGFGLLRGDVAFLTSTLVAIDITLAGLFWALGGEDDVIGRFLKKILYVGAFALVIGSFSTLADIIFRSFAGLGITAGGGALTADQLLKPGFIASTGFDAAKPLLDQVSQLIGVTSFFENFLTIIVLLISWLLVILAFFILAVQLFITIIEFKLTSLAGFVLVPFALWNRTAFLAERVLGNVIASGIKVMVLAVIVGIGSGFFAEFKAAAGQQADLTQSMSLVLASLSLLGLGIFGPGIASGLIAGAPQLGAGAAVATSAAAVGSVAVAGSAVAGGARAIGRLGAGAVRAGTAMGTAASSAFRPGHDPGARSATGPAAAGVGGLGGTHVGDGLSRSGGASGSAATGEPGPPVTAASASAATAGEGAPEWARRLRAEQSSRHYRQTALQALREGDHGGAGANPDISEKED